MAQALYQRLVESQIFNTQAEAREWGDKKKEQYLAADNPVKIDIVPADPTRRRWKAQVFLKV